MSSILAALMTDLPTVLWLDNDLAFLWPYIDALRDAGYRVVVAERIGEARRLISTERRLDVAVLDVMIPLFEDEAGGEATQDIAESHGGYRAGLLVGRYIRENRPGLPFIGLSVRADQDIRTWFELHGAGFATKFELSDPGHLVEFVAGKMRRSILPRSKLLADLTSPAKTRSTRVLASTLSPSDGPEHKIFIVHGRDHSVRDKIDLFLTKELHLRTIVMEAGAFGGRTLPEKFEQMAHEAAFAVFIMTADDHLLDKVENRELKRARQNVILELGFFWGLLGRTRSVALLVADDALMELPSDIQGLGCIPITKDLGETKHMLLRELTAAHLVK